MPQVFYNDKPGNEGTLLYERVTPGGGVGQLWIGSEAALSEEWLRAAEIDFVLPVVELDPRHPTVP